MATLQSPAVVLPGGYAPRAVQFHPHGVNSTSPGYPHVRPMGVHRACGGPGETKKNTHPKMTTPRFRGQVPSTTGGGEGEYLDAAPHLGRAAGDEVVFFDRGGGARKAREAREAGREAGRVESAS